MAGSMKCNLEELTPPYLAEVRRRQPHRPYYLGGWSAGGMYAFDAAQGTRTLLRDRRSPDSDGLALSLSGLKSFVHASTSTSAAFNFWIGRAAQVAHSSFPYLRDSLNKYRAKPFARGHGPKTHILWAKDGVCKNPGDRRLEPRADGPQEMNWLLNNRTNFGPTGWDALLGATNVVVETLDKANHFSLMKAEKAAELASFVERATN